MSKCFPPLVCAACTPLERHSQWILSWYSISVASNFEIGGAALVTYRCVRIFLQAFTRRHVSRATCCRSTQDRHLHRSGGSARRMVPRRSRSDQPFGRYSRKYLDTQTSQLKCRRSLTSLLLPCFQLVGKCTGLTISLSHSMHVLPSWTVAHVVNALVVSSIRYCVAIYWSCNITQLNRIQKLLNFCARVISGRRKFQHISDVLQQLRWLPAVQLVKNHRLCLVKTALEPAV